MTPFERMIWAQIRAICRRRVPNETERNDVAQIAWVYYWNTGREPKQVVADAIRTHFGTDARTHSKRNTSTLDNPHHIASIYPTDEELRERAIDEHNQDLWREWRKLPAAERARRVSDSHASLLTSGDI